ncbi:hypothetical protein [Anabaena sp. AL93]|uniref:hypothetical protein n=1 Tax=Anabaena sp. AL93 TaxID=1678133 RepID=UPI0008010340|nr:hypothetical protein [Anabaena sp. AL93]OBQ17631.1 MAG: hypothetical protein AN486_14520 [Anabaena sp. AL93]
MKTSKNSTFNINLHVNQKKIFLCDKPYKLLVCGRRFGKSHELRTEALVAALSFNQPYDPNFPPTVVIAMPTLKQARQVHWKALKGMLKNAPFVQSINNSELRISFKGNKPDVILRGTNEDDGDGLRGLKIYFAAVDEFQDIKVGIWDNTIFPALSDTPGSKALLCATPKGRSHPLYKFYQKIKDLKEWAYFNFYTKDNPHFPKSQLRIAKSQMPPKSYRQEFQASWEDFDGQLFDQLNDSHFISNIRNIPSDLSFYIGCDWGDTNPAFIVPDDRPAAIKSARILGNKQDISGLKRAVQVSRSQLGVMSSIEIINNLFYQNNLFINSSLTEVKSQFQDYHRASDKDGNLLNKPADCQSDHLIDAARYVIALLYVSIQNKTLKLKS